MLDSKKDSMVPFPDGTFTWELHPQYHLMRVEYLSRSQARLLKDKVTLAKRSRIRKMRECASRHEPFNILYSPSIWQSVMKTGKLALDIGSYYHLYLLYSRTKRV
jgi:hypothetical protein